MPLSRETQDRMREIEAVREEQAQSARFTDPDNMVAWQCPSCGSVYEQEGLCPVDHSTLRQITKWTESVESSDDSTVEEVMSAADELYPKS